MCVYIYTYDTCTPLARGFVRFVSVARVITFRYTYMTIQYTYMYIHKYVCVIYLYTKKNDCVCNFVLVYVDSEQWTIVFRGMGGDGEGVLNRNNVDEK